MNYKVFARKWRPKKFCEVVGQLHVVKAIIHSLNLNRMHHAYIFTGTRGSGKTTIARLFAKGLNCETQITSDVCGSCKNCSDIESGCFIDLIEIDAASKSKVEDTRSFLDNVQYSPSQGKFKVYLIDEVHMLSRHSFNALLKTLEEPPKHVKFILVTTEYQKLPETILSRCLQFYFKPLNIIQIVTQLKYICNQENINIDTENSLEFLAYAARGSIRDALNLLEQAMILGKNNITIDVINSMLGLLHIEHALSLIESLTNGNINKIMNQIDNYSILGINWDYLFEEILIVLQKIAIYQFSPHSLKNQISIVEIKDIEKRMHKLSDFISPENVQLYYQIFLLGRRELSYAPSHRIGMEMTMLRALAFCPVNLDSKSEQYYNSENTSNKEEVCKNFSKKNVTQLININKYTDSISDKKQQIQNNFNNVTHTEKIKNIQDLTNVSGSKLEKLQLSLTNQAVINNKIISSNSKIRPQYPISHVTSEILDARNKLIKYQRDYKQSMLTKTKSNINTQDEQGLEDILRRFTNIDVKISKDGDIHNKKK
ncbi:DNA polymerase III subunit gamma [Candidatus Blochmanniella floridana]|uniref:DNA polymerase III subunit gamma/tau n=1 Tax=Blochmanniella floridana TaxID=203907 RepID=Q7VRB7_BLOFL|nr:DNA polymerase III subunit gamma [Candidatus Blochmannia floridanus]